MAALTFDKASIVALNQGTKKDGTPVQYVELATGEGDKFKFSITSKDLSKVPMLDPFKFVMRGKFGISNNVLYYSAEDVVVEQIKASAPAK